MTKDKNIYIISSNSLVCIGLKSVLADYFSIDTVHIANGFDSFIADENKTSPDLIFLPPNIYVIHEYFQSIKNKVVVMLDKNDCSFVNQSSITFLDISLSQSEIVDNLNSIINSKIKTKRADSLEGLTLRETEVLKLVARGLMNKQIADNLYISLHTVISHRKNLTRKLGIYTVSGLTVYALLNGLITSDDLDSVNIQRQD